MERQETERVTDRQEIKSRQKKFFAFCLAILIGCMPTVNVMAATIHIQPEQGTMIGLKGRTIETGDIIQREGSGSLKVSYVVPGDNYDDIVGYNEDAYSVVSKFGLNKYTIVDSNWDGTYYGGGGPGLYTITLGQYTPKKAADGNGKKEEDDDSDDSDDTPFIYNPDALAAVYYENGVPSWKAKFGKQTQGAACAMAFKNALPAGWKEGITFSMSVEDKHTYDPKTGTLVLCVPDALQKTGRQYAVMGIDKNSKVTVFYDTDNKPFLFTSKLNLEGYAFALIYKEP